VLAVERVEQRKARLARVGLDADGDRVIPADVAAVDVDLDDRRPGLDVAVVEVGGEVPEPRADDEQQVGPPAGGGGLRGAGAAERADVERMRVRHGVVAAVGGDHRQRVLLGEPRHEVVGFRPRDAAAGDQQRTVRGAQQPRGLPNGVEMGRQRVDGAIALGGKRRRRLHRLAQHVARDLDQDRPPAAAHGRPQRRPHDLGDALGLVHRDGELGHRLEHGHEVVVLERILVLVRAIDAADQGDHRRMGHEGRRHAGEEVGGAGAARHQAGAGPAAHAGEAVGHERRRLLVADVDVLEALVVVERVEDVEERRADDAEEVLHALGLQQLDDGPPARDAIHQNHLALSTTLRSGWPARKRRQLSSRISKRRSSRKGPKPAVCGVSRTLGSVHSGWSAGSGSCS